MGTTALTLKDELITFLRSKDYVLKKELGGGACGKTVLLYDAPIDTHFVCKKYAPFSETERIVLYESFVREIKLLFSAHHKNVVRVFSYFLYPDKYAGYIVMEYVEGNEIDKYVAAAPEKVNDLFLQAIEGFAYLESIGILHRDIRYANLMVGQTGQLKIIDLGFGKRVKTSADYDMSIRLNWAATIPQEFSNDTYDFTTEIYFVGKLFESLIVQNDIRDFKFTDVLRVMCSREPHLRIKSFAEVERKLGADRFADSEFSEEAVRSYRAFADSVANALAEVGDSAEYSTDLDKIQTGLSTTLRQVMLEEYVPDSRLILKHLIDGSYRYFPRNKIEVAVLREFVRLLQAVSESEKRIIIGNLHTRLDTVKRFDRNLEDEDIPF